jgi:hypothetical protein
MPSPGKFIRNQLRIQTLLGRAYLAKATLFLVLIAWMEMEINSL